MRHPFDRGHTLHEYGLLLGLLAVLAISSLNLLGHSIQALLGLNPPVSGPGSVNQYMNLTLGMPPMLTGPTQSVTPITDPLPLGDNPQEILLNGASPVAVNVSSIEGNDKTVLGNFRLAAYLDQLAQQEPEPGNRAYYAQLAKLAYYMGANEGHIDGFDVYGKGNTPSSYTNGDALNDLVAKAAEFKALASHPPATLHPDELAQVLPVTREVSSISDNYLKNLGSLIGSNGKVNFDFTIDNATGSAAAHYNPINANFVKPLSNSSYDNLVPYDQLKAQVKTTLGNHALPINIPVVSTFQDADNVDQHGNRGWQR